MGDMDIAFPNLGIYLRNVPKTIMIGNFGIALYGIVIAIGMILGLTMSARIAKKTGQDPDVIWDLAAPLIIFSILGARIYYVIFMWDFYKNDPIQILNIRGGEYAGNPELFVKRRYWLDAMRIMRAKRPDMKFLVVTDDPEAAAKVLPEVRAEHGDLAHDYTIVKNARFLILSNSSFACFPAFTGDAELVIAPKYWARHNVSDGFWSSEQNLYPSFTYLDREGKLFSAEDCRKELETYKVRTNFAEKIGRKPTKEELAEGRKQVEALHRKDLRQRAALSLKRRLHLIRQRDSL